MPPRKRPLPPSAELPAITDSLGRPVSPTKGRKRRTPGEAGRRDERMVYLSTVRMDAVAHALLRLAAAQRAVSMNTLVSDVLVLWMGHALDPRQGAAKRVTGGRALPQVPERFAGYHASLGYAPAATPEPPPFQLEPKRDPREAPPTLPPAEAMAQVLREEAAIARGAQETAEPPPSTPTPEPPYDPNPFGHLRPGVGNAAQAYEVGFNPLPPADAYVPSHAQPRTAGHTDR